MMPLVGDRAKANRLMVNGRPPAHQNQRREAALPLRGRGTRIGGVAAGEGRPLGGRRVRPAAAGQRPADNSLIPAAARLSQDTNSRSAVAADYRATSRTTTVAPGTSRVAPPATPVAACPEPDSRRP